MILSTIDVKLCIFIFFVIIGIYRHELQGRVIQLSVFLLFEVLNIWNEVQRMSIVHYFFYLHLSALGPTHMSWIINNKI